VAIVQKLLRDHTAAGLIDGSTPICLHAVAAQLPLVLRENQGQAQAAARRVSLSDAVPPFDVERLRVSASRADDLTSSAPPELASGLRELGSQQSLRRRGDDLEAARHYGLLHAAACAALFEAENPALPLARLKLGSLCARRLQPTPPLEAREHDLVFEQLAQAVTSGRLLSITSVEANE
jgi:hypothetical protein